MAEHKRQYTARVWRVISAEFLIDEGHESNLLNIANYIYNTKNAISRYTYIFTLKCIN